MISGYYSIQDVARRCGISYGQFYHMVRRARTLPAPTHKVGNLNKPYYSQADLDGFVKLFAKYTQQKGS